MDLKKNDSVRLKIDGMTLQGQGIARHEGLAVFVPAAAIGDELCATVVKREKRLAYAKIDKIIKAGRARLVRQECPVYPRCGGCAFRHISYEEELKVKAQSLSDALLRIGGLEPDIRTIIPSENPERYRNKAQYPIAVADGKIRAGFYAPRSHRVLPCEDCLLQPAEFSALVRAVLEYAESHGITAYDEISHTGRLRHIYLRQSAKTREILLCLVTADSQPLPDTDKLYNVLQASAAVSGLLQNINPKRSNVVLGPQTRLLFGQDSLEDNILGVDLQISPLAFYQVNHAQAEKLYSLAIEAAALKGSESVLELHCGSGLLGLTMAGRCRWLVGVDIVPEAIRDAEENANRNGIKNARFICADAKDAVKKLIVEGFKADVVLLDPPRAGCGAGLIETVCAVAPQRIVYISCNPATLARDCAIFAENGYLTQHVTPVDMFPRTKHVETVVLLSKLKEPVEK